MREFFYLFKNIFDSTAVLVIFIWAMSAPVSATVADDNSDNLAVSPNVANTSKLMMPEALQEIQSNNTHSFVLTTQHLTLDLVFQPYFNTLFGSQFFLRPVFPEDYTAFLPGLMDANHMKYYWHGKPLSLEETKKYAQTQAINNTVINPKMFSWSIITHQGVAGHIMLQMPNEEWHEKALGYFICSGFEGRGLATDASRLAMSFIEGPYIATVHPLNFGSSSVLKKLGFKVDSNRLSVPRYGSIRDFYLRPEVT